MIGSLFVGILPAVRLGYRSGRVIDPIGLPGPVGLPVLLGYVV